MKVLCLSVFKKMVIAIALGVTLGATRSAHAMEHTPEKSIMAPVNYLTKTGVGQVILSVAVLASAYAAYAVDPGSATAKRVLSAYIAFTAPILGSAVVYGAIRGLGAVKSGIGYSWDHMKFQSPVKWQ